MFDPTQEQRMLVDAVQEIAATFEADAFEWQGAPPWENVERLADHGFVGVNIDESYGGGGMSELEAILVTEAVGSVCPDTAELLMNCSLVAPRAIEMFGTEAVKERYLPPVVAGESFVAIAMSEPEAGSDLRAMNTTVRETDDGLVVDGEKLWVGMVEEATAAVLWAKFPEGMGTLVLDLDAPGVEVTQEFTNMHGKTQSHLTLDAVPVPRENVLTRGPAAFDEQLRALNWERIGAAAFSNAVARNALGRALDYAETREQFGQPIGEFQGIEWKLADMVTAIERSRALTYRAAEDAIASGDHPDPMAASMAKLTAADTANEVVSEALQIHGANGYMRGHPLEYLYRFARGYRIAGGTDEIQRNTIARRLKRDGLPPLL
jgi:hypothetical protein